MTAWGWKSPSMVNGERHVLGVESHPPIMSNCVKRCPSQNYALNYWKDNGAPAEKLLIGFPTYGQTFTLRNPSDHTVGAPISGPGPAGKYTQQAGSLGYFEVSTPLMRDFKDFIKQRSSKQKWERLSSYQESVCKFQEQQLACVRDCLQTTRIKNKEGDSNSHFQVLLLYYSLLLCYLH